MKLTKGLFIILFFCACSCNERKKSEPEKIIIFNVLDDHRIKEWVKQFDKGYLVYPYFEDFNFHNAITIRQCEKPCTTEFGESVFSKLDVDYEGFQKLRKRVNSKYQKTYSEFLNNMSTTDKSSILFVFSGISDQLLFMYTYVYFDKLDRTDLEKNFSFEKGVSMVFTSAFIIDLDQKNIIEVFTDGGAHVEQ